MVHPLRATLNSDPDIEDATNALYDNLVGRYITPSEIDSADTTQLGNNRAIIEITRLLTNTRYTLLDLLAIVHTQITCNELRTDTGITFTLEHSRDIKPDGYLAIYRHVADQLTALTGYRLQTSLVATTDPTE